MRPYTLFILLFLPHILVAQALETQFQQQLETAFEEHPDAVGVLLHIESPEHKMSWSTAIGYSDAITKTKLDPEQPVLIASITKPYVAVAILRLVEMNKFNLDSPIKKLLKRKTCKLFKKDGYNLDKITIRHLLSHTSGIADYVDDAYFNFVNDQPQHQWKKSEQIQRSIDIGNPLFEPGSDHKYGDINYLLLTEIIEKSTKKPFYISMNQLLKFDELNIKNTWFKDLEPYPADTKPMAHQYSKKNNWDSYDINPSWDLYGGGGIATTVKEAALFFQYLFEGKIIEDNAMLEELYKFVLPKEKSNYCLGFRNITMPTFTAYYHGGWWGTDVAYSPESKSSVAIFTLQKAKRGEFAQLSIGMMKILADKNNE